MSDVKTKYHYEGGRLIVERVQDIEPTIEANKKEMGEWSGHNESSRWKGDFHHVARIPEVVIEKWCNENGFTYADFIKDPKIAKRFLNDSQNCLFRTKPGRI